MASKVPPPTEQEKQQIIRLAKAGMKRNEIAKKVRRGNKTVLSVLMSAGLMHYRPLGKAEKIEHMQTTGFFDETAHENWII